MVLIIKHIGMEGPGTLGDFLESRSRPFRTIELQAGEVLPRSLEGIEAVVSLGGPMNVYEEEKYPFLREEAGFIRKVLGSNIPFLGICLGAQLLAKACQGRVKKNPVREIGWYEINLTEVARLDPLFAGSPQTMTVFQWHQDTFDIPASAERLAYGSTCHNQAFRFGRNAYGFQFHLEITGQMIVDWIGAYRGELDGFDADAMLTEGARHKNALAEEAQRIYLNFFRPS